MSTRIRHKRSTTAGVAPTNLQLDTGEFVINTADGKVFIKKEDTTVSDITKRVFQGNTKLEANDDGVSTSNLTATIDGVDRVIITPTELQTHGDLSIENAKSLILSELTANGSNYIGIKAPNTLLADYTLTLPTATGSIGQVLGTDGSGNLSFRDVDTFGGNRIYVSDAKGNDLNDGVSAPVKTIKRALQLASALVYTSGGAINGTRVIVAVAAGDYSEDNPIIVPDNVVVKGDGLRSCIIRPLNANKDMLRVRNGCYFAEMTFRDAVDGSFVPQFTWDYTVAFDDYTDASTSRVGYTYLPNTKPVIVTSPYIQNCSIISFLGGNGVLIDGNLVTTPNTPVNQIEAENPVSGPAPQQGKSMVSNAFTMLSFGGTGWRVINDAYSQIVSCFQIFMLNGVYAQSGGYVSITNSATNFGLYALRSSGYSPNAFDFDKSIAVATGTVDGFQTLEIIGLGRAGPPVEQFVIRFRDGSNVDITNSFSPATTSVSFNSATAVNTSTNVITISSHGFNNTDAVVYDANGGTVIAGLDDEQTYYVGYINANEFKLFFDESLTFEVNITAVGVGTQFLISGVQEFYVYDIIEDHTVYQTLTLAAGTYSFVPGRLITGTTGAGTNSAYVYSYNSGTRELVVSINNVIISSTTVRNLFTTSSIITSDHTSPTPVTSIGVSAVSSRTDLGSSRFTIKSTKTGGVLSNLSNIPENQLWFHRPSIVNSSSHTWEYAGSGTDYNALPQNGGEGRPLYEQVSELPGRVYTSGTNELGDFKVGDFITAFNRTGNITFTNKVTVGTLDTLRLSLSDVVVTAISTNQNLGDDEPGGASNSRLSTQLAARAFIANRLGPFVDQSVSTNAVPGALVQLNVNGLINSDLLPATRTFVSTSVNGFGERVNQWEDVPPADLLNGDLTSETYEQRNLTLSSAVTAAAGVLITQAVTGAQGYLKSSVTSSTSIIVASTGAAFNATFNTTNNLTINGDATPSDTNTAVNPTIVGSVSETTDNYFLAYSLESQFLKLNTAGTYTFTIAAISTVARNGSNVATVVTTANHNLSDGNVVRVTCSDATFNGNVTVTYVDATTFTYSNTGGVVVTTAATGTVRSLVTEAAVGSQGEVTEYRAGALTAVDNITIAGGSGYLTPGTYSSVTLTGGSGSGAKANIVVNSSGVVNSVDLVRSGSGYVVGNSLSAADADIGGRSGGTPFSITVTTIEKRLYVDLIGGQTFIASTGSPGFIADNTASRSSVSLTASSAISFDAADVGSGGDVTYATSKITYTTHGLINGDPVRYISAPNVAIGGLTNNSTVYAKRLDADNIELYTDYNLATKIDFISSSSGTHSLTKYNVDTLADTIVVPAHGFSTGEAIQLIGATLPEIDSVAIPTGTYFFVGSVTTNSFTLHSLRSDALSSIGGLQTNRLDITSHGTGTGIVVDQNTQIVGVVNTSSRNANNFNSLSAGNIDASNIVSGVIDSSRLAFSGTANSASFLRGDSSWAAVVQSITPAASSPITLLGTGSGPYTGAVTVDINRVDNALAVGSYTNTGVASFFTTQFDVGTGVNVGKIFIKNGVVDAGTLDTYDSSYFLDPSNLSSAVPTTKGGTALSSYATGDILYATGTNILGKLPIGYADTVLDSTGTAPEWSPDLTLAKGLTVNSNSITVGSVSKASIFDTNARTVSVGSAAGSTFIGESSTSIDLASDVATYTAATSVYVSVNLATFTKATSATSNNGTAILFFANTTSIRVGQVVTVVAGTIPAGTTVTGFGSGGQVYLSASITSSILSAVTVTFQETPVSVGISEGDYVTIAGSTLSNLDGTWPVYGASATANSFVINTDNNVTASAVTQLGTIVRINSIVLRTSRLVVGALGAAAPAFGATIRGCDAMGVNITASDLVIQPGLATGSGTSGNFVVKVGTGGVTGFTQHPTGTARLTISSTTATFATDVAVNGGDLTTSASTFNIGNTATTTHTTNLITAATASGATKTINVGTGGVSGSTTVINIGTSVSGSTSTVNINGDLTISGASIGTSPEVTGITAAGTTVVDTWAIATYRVVKYIVSITCTAGTDNGTYQTSELLVIHNGTTATLTEYAVIKTGSNELITFTCDISGGNVRLIGQATTGNTVKVRPNRTLVNL